MQLKTAIIDTFSRRGYMQHLPISKREFHILMNTLLAHSLQDHSLFHQNLTNQIWRQASQRLTKQSLNPSKQLLNPAINAFHSAKQNQQLPHIKTQIVILTMVDAIQILTNRIIQCEERIDQLKLKRQKFEFQQNFIQLQPLQKKIEILKLDALQFDQDFKMLTQPFMTPETKLQLKRHSLNRKPSKNDQSQKRQTFDKGKLFEQVLNIHNNMQKKPELQLFVEPEPEFTTKPSETLFKRSANFKQQKNCAFYLLIFLSLLELTVCMIKFDFVNLLVYILIFVFLDGDSFLPHLIKLGFGALFLSIIIDAIWLVTYMKSYLHLFLDAAVKKQLKPYYQYIWFVTLLQTILKLLLLYFVKSYQLNFLTQEKKNKLLQLENDPALNDDYIPDIRNLANADSAKDNHQLPAN